MKASPFETIMHPTDFSPASDAAFAHALAISLAARSRFFMLHVEPTSRDPHRDSFPHVRETLARWGRLEPGAPETAVAERLGVEITKATLGGAETRHGVLAFAATHGCDLMVLASHERTGPLRWFGESLGERTARSAHVSTLFVRENHRGFIDPATGVSGLRNILLPVDAHLHCAPAWKRIVAFATLFEPRPRLHLLHVGARTPIVRDERGHPIDVPIKLRQGAVVETILAEAEALSADLIAMPTAGHHGVLDALRGSTTERVLHNAPCPVLATPVTDDGLKPE